MVATSDKEHDVHGNTQKNRSMKQKILGLISHSQAPLWLSVFVLAGSIGFSAYVENGSRKVQILQIQQQLRDRYLNYKPVLDSLEIRKYPNEIASYTPEQRYQLSRYWSEIQFNEYVVIKKFGRGELEDEWAPVYGVWAANSLDEFQVLREEFCFFVKNEKAYMGGYGDEFERDIRNSFKEFKKDEVINCDALLASRAKNTDYATTKK